MLVLKNFLYYYVMERIVWKDIPGYEGLYQASNMGGIRNLNYNHTGRIKELKPGKSSSGYYHVSLQKNTRKTTIPVAKCVWTAFNGSIPKGMQINHLNENKSDNRLENLSLATPKENINWGTHNSRSAATQTNGKRSKPVIQTTVDGVYVKTWPSLNEIKRNTEYSMGNIGLCCQGKRKQAYGFKWEYEKREAV